jgi:hypothetical protein
MIKKKIILFYEIILLATGYSYKFTAYKKANTEMHTCSSCYALENFTKFKGTLGTRFQQSLQHFYHVKNTI